VLCVSLVLNHFVSVCLQCIMSLGCWNDAVCVCSVLCLSGVEVMLSVCVSVLCLSGVEMKLSVCVSYARQNNSTKLGETVRPVLITETWDLNVNDDDDDDVYSVLCLSGVELYCLFVCVCLQCIVSLRCWNDVVCLCLQKPLVSTSHHVIQHLSSQCCMVRHLLIFLIFCLF
jgi:hypothetical protein